MRQSAFAGHVLAALISTATTALAQGIPLVFEPNFGQAAAGCEFVARAAGSTLRLQGGTAAIVQEGGTTTLQVVGADTGARLEAERWLAGHIEFDADLVRNQAERLDRVHDSITATVDAFRMHVDGVVRALAGDS